MKNGGIQPRAGTHELAANKIKGVSLCFRLGNDRSPSTLPFGRLRTGLDSGQAKLRMSGVDEILTKNAHGEPVYPEPAEGNHERSERLLYMNEGDPH